MPPKGKRKRGHGEFRINIPSKRDAVVTRVEVTRNNNQRILTKSTKVSIPVTTDPSSLHPSPETLESSPPVLDDTSPNTKKARKGPSRSVAVRHFPSPFSPQCMLTTKYIDKP